MASPVDFSKYNLSVDKSGLGRGISDVGNLIFGQRQREAELQRLEEQRMQEAQAMERNKRLKGLAHQANRIYGMPSIHEKRKAIALMGQEAFNRGGDVQAWQQLLDIDDVDTLNTALLNLALRADPDVYESANSGNRPNLQRGSTRYAKDSNDNLFILSDTFNPGDGNIQDNVVPVGHNEKPAGQLVLVGGTGETADEKTERAITEFGQKEEKKTTEELLRLQNELQEKLKTNPDIKLQEKLAETKAQLITGSFEQAARVRDNIRNFEEVVRLVEKEGAETGPISNLFPNFRAASVELDNMQKRLGLDVIAMGNFGPLSEGELSLALKTALPTNLDGPDLIKWAKDKIDAQRKLANELERYGVFLADGGTQAEWVKNNQKSKAAMEDTEYQSLLQKYGIGQ